MRWIGVGVIVGTVAILVLVFLLLGTPRTLGP
jgi:hypothetical protein